jgi:hypothetical protein
MGPFSRQFWIDLGMETTVPGARFRPFVRPGSDLEALPVWESASLLRYEGSLLRNVHKCSDIAEAIYSFF